METVVCFKQAINEAEIRVDKSSKKIILEGVPTKLSEFDKNAIEEAVRIKEKLGGRITGITVAPAEATKTVKEALAMGCDQVIHLSDPSLRNSDTYATALIVSSAVKKLGKFDLILCAEGSSDIYSAQVGPMLAEILSIPQITYVRKLTVEAGKAKGERNMEEGIEHVEAPLPCLITVTSEVNVPRLPTLMQIMAASKKPVIQWTPQDLELTGAPVGDNSLIKVKKMEALTSERKGIRVEGTSPAEQAANLVKALVKEGVLR